MFINIRMLRLRSADWKMAKIDTVFTRVSGVALIRGWSLFNRLIPQRQNILIVQFTLLHEYFSWPTGLKLT